jgi:hypothetical protein
MAKLGPVAGFPRWTGVRADVCGPTVHRDGALVINLNVRITRRARWWARWRMLTGRWPTDAAAHG